MEVINMTKTIEEMNEEELIECLAELEKMEAKLEKIYSECFGEEIGETKSGTLDINLFEKILGILYGIYHARSYANKRLMDDFGVFVM